MPFATEDFQTNQIDADVMSGIIMAGADEAPLISAIMARGVQQAISTEVEWADQDNARYRTQINNPADNYTGSTTTIVVDSTADFSENDLVICEATGEVIRVASITNATTMIIERGVGATTGQVGSVADDAFLRNIGGAHGEGADRATPGKQTSTRRTNYCQIFKEGVEITNTAAAVGTNTEDEWARQRLLGTRRFLHKMSRSAYFGVKSADMVDSQGRIIRTMDGLYRALQSNVYDPAGALTERKLWDAIEPAFAAGSPVKTMFAGSVVVKQVNEIFGDRIRNVQGATAFGMNANRIVTPFGELDMVYDRALNGPYGRDAVVADMEELVMKALRPMAIEEGTQTNGADTTAEEIKAEVSLTYGAEKNHCRIENVQDA